MFLELEVVFFCDCLLVVFDFGVEEFFDVVVIEVYEVVVV